MINIANQLGTRAQSHPQTEQTDMEQTSNISDRISALSDGLLPSLRPKPPDIGQAVVGEAEAHNADTLVVTPLSWDHVYKRHHAAMMSMAKPRTGNIWIDGDTIDDMRCKAVDLARERGFKWLFFVDADMVVPQDALERLRAHGKPIIGGLCRQRKEPFRCTTYKLQEDGFLTWWHPAGLTGVTQVDATGAACLLIDMEVFAAIDRKFPVLVNSWFVDARRIPGLKPQEKVSEDLWFCALARAAGYEIYVDLDLIVGHLVMGEIVDDGTPEHGARFRLE